MVYAKQKRRKVDKCNICGNIDELTWNHVPPKSCFNNKLVEYNTFYEDVINAKAIIAGDKLQRYTTSQNGVKYRSLCGKCNNDLLGAKYDPELERLTKFTHNLVNSKITLPSNVNLSLKLNKLSRSIIGHILSAKNNFEDQVLTDLKLRKYFLDTSSLPPKEMKLLFRIYPYEEIVIQRDCVVGSMNRKDEFPSGSLDCLSFYPVAFVLCSDGSNCGQLDIFSKCTTNINDVMDFTIDLSTYKHPNSNVLRHFLWPINVSDDEYGASFLLASGSSSDSVITKKRKC